MLRRLAAPTSRVARRFGLPGGDFVRGSVTIAAGTGLAQIIGIAAAPILTRLFSPAEFGAYSLALAILAIVAVVACLTYEEAIPLPRTDLGAANVLALCIVLALLLSAALAITLAFGGRALLELMGASSLEPYALLLAVGMLASGLGLALLGWAVRMKSYGEIAANRLTRAGTIAGAQIGLGLLGWGAAGLLVGAVLGMSVAAARLAFVAWRGHGASMRRVSSAGLRDAAHRYRRFPLMTAPATLLNSVGLELPLLMIVALFGTTVGGQFALAHRVMVLPLTLVANAIGKTYFSEAARVMRDDPSALRGLFLNTTKWLALVTIGPVIVVALLSPFLFGLVFGEEWTEAGMFAMVLAPMYYLQLITNPTHGTLVVLERQDLHLQREIARIFLLGGALLVAWWLSLPPVSAVALLSLAGALIYAWYGITSWRAIQAYERRTRSEDEPPVSTAAEDAED